MKFRLLLLFWLFGITTMYADEATMVIKQKSGSEMWIELSSHPVITFESETMVITSDITTVSIPLSAIDDYSISEGSTGISPVTTKPRIANGRIIFDHIAAGTSVCVHTVDGRIVSQQTIGDSGKAEVSLDALPKGAYIISAGNHKIKVINK